MKIGLYTKILKGFIPSHPEYHISKFIYDFIKKIININYGLNIQWNNHFNKLHNAIKYSNKNVIEKILKSKDSLKYLTYIDNNGNTPLVLSYLINKNKKMKQIKKYFIYY